MNVMRYTIIDERGAISFVDTVDMLAALVVTCRDEPHSIEELLVACNRYAPGFRNWMHNGLAIFDEHNSGGHLEYIHEQIQTLPPEQTPIFRVLDDMTRQASLQPVKTGVVLFNLVQRRIVQIHNTWAEVERKGQLPVENDRPNDLRYIPYELPETWTIVP